MAAALFRAQLAKRGETDRYRVESAGTWGVDGQPASRHALTVMRERGLSLQDHTARTITADMMREADLVFAMTRSHRDALAAEFPGARAKLHLTSEFCGLEYDISDPYGNSLDAYETCAADLEQLLDRGYARVAIWLEGAPHRTSHDSS
ncbi:MAG: low molecular weight protein arginine phosphatase [Chloroflexi bacterium]|nr:low molecular weight protein arginine phosphatase [Chloroflexota bacterium]